MKALAARERELIEFARELVAIPSPAPPGDERKVAERAQHEMKRLGYEGIQTIAMEAERPNLVGEIGGGGQVLMLNGHIDTKPPGDLSEWETGPFDPVIREGRLYGLGSADMKGAVAAMVYAGSAIAEAGGLPNGTLRVVLTADEEAGSRFGARFLAGRPELAADAVLVGEPTGMQTPWSYVAVASRGIACFRVRVGGPLPPSSIDPGHPLVAATKSAAQDVLQREVPLKTMPAFTDGSYWSLAGAACIPAFGPGTLLVAHRPNENVAVDELTEAARIYALTALRYLGEGAQPAQS